ncbi:hypothetical protein [Bosea psychrotolerans]|uniref:Uncharacterized protein n=1 Tax=Bosea psychrotolerans TaxID=1871628 RepID=A0A2S4LX14_9HYPH|nr:hypothetical protein [Bosea psychrotolerans]POR46994.1 hypothetical protein CYD53_12179 [Bosea psychrotolerans]
MGVANPIETVLGVLTLLDETHAKMNGTKLASFPWRPASPESADDLTDLVHEALERCSDVTEAVIVVTVAAMASRKPEHSRSSNTVSIAAYVAKLKRAFWRA